MPRTFEERIAGVLAEFEPASPIGAEFVRCYVQQIRGDGSAATQSGEIMLLRDLCQMVAEKPVRQISIEEIEALNDPPAKTSTRRERRRRVLDRVIRILQADGGLPSTEDLRYDRRLHALLDEAAPWARDNLRHWFAARHGVCPYERYHEARRLELLEDVLAAQPSIGAEAAIASWLDVLVRPIVDCSCPPVTRAKSALCCNACGATAQSHGTRPSPGPAKQDELRSLAGKYLAQRKAHTLAGWAA